MHNAISFNFKVKSIKDVRSQGGLSSAEKAGGLQMQTSTLFGIKNIEFLEIHDVSARTRGERVKPVRTFWTKGGVKFLRFCADVFYGRSLLIVKLLLS